MSQTSTHRSSASSDSHTLWSDLRAALRGTNADYTRIPLKRAVFLLAIPMMLELVLESTFAVVDIFFVAKLGASAVATVGLTETYLFLLYSVAMGLSMAVTAIVARRVGEQGPLWRVLGRVCVRDGCGVVHPVAFFSRALEGGESMT